MPVSYADYEVTVMSSAQGEEGSANQKIGSKAALSFSPIVAPIASARMSVSAQIIQTHDLGYRL